MRNMICCSASCTVSISLCRIRSRSPPARLRSIRASASSFFLSRRKAPTCFERSFTSARRVSRSRLISRRRVSRATASSTCARRSGFPRRAKADRTPSRFVRRSRTSITGFQATCPAFRAERHLFVKWRRVRCCRKSECFLWRPHGCRQCLVRGSIRQCDCNPRAKWGRQDQHH